MIDNAQAASRIEPATLYYSKVCFQSLKIKAVLDHLKVQCSLFEVEFGAPAQLPTNSVYRSPPVLQHGERLVEDSRAILLYLDEVFGGDTLQVLGTDARAEFFDRMEILDNEILPDLIAPLAQDGYSMSVNCSPRGPLYRAYRRMTSRGRLWRYLNIESLDEIDGNFTKALKRSCELISQSFFMRDKTPYLTLSLRAVLEAVSNLEKYRKLVEQESVIKQWSAEKNY